MNNLITPCCCGMAVGELVVRKREGREAGRGLFPAGAPARNTEKCVGCRAAAAARPVAAARLVWLADTDCRPMSQLRVQVAQLSQRDLAAGWVSYGQKWKTGTGKKYLRTIYVCIQPLRRIWPAKKSKSAKKRKIRAITPFKVIEVGTNRKPVCDLLLVINNN